MRTTLKKAITSASFAEKGASVDKATAEFHGETDNAKFAEKTHVVFRELKEALEALRNTTIDLFLDAYDTEFPGCREDAERDTR